mgnify:CR=1 FL=1
MKIAIIGAGNMGGSIARGLAKGSLIDDSDIIVSNPSAGKLEKLKKEFPGISTTNNNLEAATGADIVILAVKPWFMESVMRELKLRGLAKRILVCAPKGLVSQWVSEMQTHFNESFQLMLPGEQKPQNEHDNIWSRYDQVVCPVDSIKPIESRKGWSLKQLNEYNKLRFDDLLAAGWDLIVIDEAHRLGGSTDQVARYKLGQGLAEAAPYLLLLSATPHQGKSDAFHRLMALLDAEAFPDVGSVTQERVQPFVVRTEKRIAIDGEGKPLFCPRQTEMVAVAWKAQHGLQRHLYEEVTEYIKEGYNQAQAKQQNAIGFLNKS